MATIKVAVRCRPFSEPGPLGVSVMQRDETTGEIGILNSRSEQRYTPKLPAGGSPSSPHEHCRVPPLKQCLGHLRSLSPWFSSPATSAYRASFLCSASTTRFAFTWAWWSAYGANKFVESGNENELEEMELVDQEKVRGQKFHVHSL